MVNEMITIKQKDWLREMISVYAPTHALWRAIEAKQLSKIKYKRPILDLGCGDGIFASKLLGIIDAGIDSNPMRIKHAKLTNAYERLDVGYVNALPYPNSSFSTVLSNSVLEHVNELEKTLKEVRRVLKKGGKFVFTTITPKFEEWMPKGEDYSKARKTEMEIVQVIPEDIWVELLKKNGLRVIHSKQYFDFETFRFWESLKLPAHTKPNRFHLLALSIISRIPNIVKSTYAETFLRKYYLRPTPKEGAGIVIIAVR